ncbi:hypothetical protein GCM10020255_018790 [Rhodococcus baikonurensis]
MRVDGIRDEAVAEACDALLESLDVLLERLANRVESAPTAAPNGKTSGVHESPQMDASDSDDTFWSKSQSPPQHASIPPTTSKWPDKPESQRPTSRASGRKTQRRAPRGNAGLTPTQTTLW